MLHIVSYVAWVVGKCIAKENAKVSYLSNKIKHVYGWASTIAGHATFLPSMTYSCSVFMIKAEVCFKHKYLSCLNFFLLFFSTHTLNSILQCFAHVLCPCFCNWQCDDSRCFVWQHISCVIIPEKPMEGNPQVPDPFYCEICRLSRADPYVSYKFASAFVWNVFGYFIFRFIF